MNGKYWICLLLIAVVAGFYGGFFFDRIVDTPSAYAQGQSNVAIRWEPIDHDSGSRMDRAKIPGGWIVRAGRGDSITFVPDAGHTWK